jgi:hypothetical protein
MVDDQLLSSEQTAELLGITTNHLRQIQWRKGLKWTSKQGNRVFYALADVEAYKEARKSRKKDVNAG